MENEIKPEPVVEVKKPLSDGEAFLGLLAIGILLLLSCKK